MPRLKDPTHLAILSGCSPAFPDRQSFPGLHVEAPSGSHTDSGRGLAERQIGLTDFRFLKDWAAQDEQHWKIVNVTYFDLLSEFTHACYVREKHLTQPVTWLDFPPCQEHREFWQEFPTDRKVLKADPPALAARDNDCWSGIADDGMSLLARIEAVSKCLLKDEARAVRVIVEQLERQCISSDWRDALVLIVEHLQVVDPVLRRRLAARLYSVATELRLSTAESARRTVLSAIRCYASIIESTEVLTLLPLLDPPAPIETRLVTLQGIVSIFEFAPPVTPDAVKPLSDRVFELAVKFLDRDLVVAGEKAAIAQNAVHALAVLGDNRLSECIRLINGLKMAWVRRIVANKLRESLESWETAGVEIAARKHLEIQLQLLTQ